VTSSSLQKRHFGEPLEGFAQIDDLCLEVILNATRESKGVGSVEEALQELTDPDLVSKTGLGPCPQGVIDLVRVTDNQTDILSTGLWKKISKDGIKQRQLRAQKRHSSSVVFSWGQGTGKEKWIKESFLRLSCERARVALLHAQCC
jgi:hypothetical protein